MNDTELDAILKTWEAPAPSPALREGVREGVPARSRKRPYGWMAAAASMAVTTSLLGIAMLGRGRAQLADGTVIQSVLQVEPASSLQRWHKLGMGFSTGGNRQQGYWYDPAAHTYTGYDLTVQPAAGGTFLMTVRPLSTPFVKLAAEADAAQYREVPLPSLPAAKAVAEGEPFDIDLLHDSQTGDRVFERITLSHNTVHGFFEHVAQTVHKRHLRFAIWLRGLFAGGSGQLHLNSPKLYINGSLVADAAGSAVSGRGVYFYLPGHGRYVLTLDAAGDRRFARAGTVKGDTIEFQLEGNSFRVACQEPIADGGDRAFYVFHEESFRENPEIPELNRPSFGAGKPDFGQ